MNHRVRGLVMLLLADKYMEAHSDTAKFEMFLCESVPQCPVSYWGTGLHYECFPRQQVTSCKGPPAAVPVTVSRGSCLRMCHFNTKCAEYIWSEKHSVCRQCAESADEEKTTSYVYSSNLRASDSSKKKQGLLVYGFVDSVPQKAEIDGVDYIQENYIQKQNL